MTSQRSNTSHRKVSVPCQPIAILSSQPLNVSNSTITPESLTECKIYESVTPCGQQVLSSHDVPVLTPSGDAMSQSRF